MSDYACILCRYWTGKADSQTGECRRFGPLRAAAGERPFPSTGPDDWCHFFAPIGGITGGRGSKLTNTEIVSAVEEADGMEFLDLREKMQLNGLAELVAEKRIEKMVGRGLLVERDGKLHVGEGKPIRKDEAETPAPDDQPEEKSAPAAPRESTKRRTLDALLPALRVAATPDQPIGMNDLFRAASEVQPIGKGTFVRLVGEAVDAGKILRYEAGRFAGKYYLETEIDPP